MNILPTRECSLYCILTKKFLKPHKYISLTYYISTLFWPNDEKKEIRASDKNKNNGRVTKQRQTKIKDIRENGIVAL